jgi:hypothetical protein
LRTTTSFSPDRKLILVRSELWGPLGPAKLRLAFDPGATITLIIPSALDILGYSPLDGTKITTTTGVVEEQLGYEIHVHRFAALGFAFTDFLVNAQDLHERAGIHGLLGLNFLRHFNYEVRSEEGLIHLEAIPSRVTPAGPSPAGGGP